MRARNMIPNSMQLLAITMLLPILWVAQIAVAETDTHEAAYLQTLERLQVAPDAIREEVQRVHSGEVEHFDYLQHAHIELLRDARAVRFPPSSLNQRQRELIKDQADQVLQSSMELELTIADFLRGQALLNAALSSTVDLIRTAHSRSNAAVQGKLLTLSKAANDFRDMASEEALDALMQAFEAVANSQLKASVKQEIAVQKDIIIRNQELVERTMNDLAAANLDRAISRLIQLFDSASPLLGSR